MEKQNKVKGRAGAGAFVLIEAQSICHTLRNYSASEHSGFHRVCVWDGKVEDVHSDLETGGWLCRGRCSGDDETQVLFGQCLPYHLCDELVHHPSVTSLNSGELRPRPFPSRCPEYQWKDIVVTQWFSQWCSISEPTKNLLNPWHLFK